MFQETSLVIQPNKYRFVMGFLIVFLCFSAGLIFLNTSPITPYIMDEFNITRGTAGLLTGVILLGNALFTIPGSLLVGRLPINKLVLIFSFGASLPILSVFASNFISLLFLRICFGICVSGFFPALNPVIMNWFPKKELPLINGLYIAALSAGIAVSFLIADPLTEIFGWQMTLTIFSFVSLLAAVLWLIFARQATIQTTTNLSLHGVFNVFRSKVTLLLATSDSGPLIQYIALSSWLPTYYYETLGIELSKANEYTAILPICGCLMVVIAGFLALKFTKRRPFMFLSGIMLGVTGFASVMLAEYSFIYVILIIYGAGSWLYTPFHATIPQEMQGTSPEKAAATIACVFAIGGSLSFLAPILIGYLADITGTYLYGFAIVAALSWSLVISTYFLPETGK